MWKGINQTQVIVYTERDSASCGYEFSPTDYLVYAHEGEGELRVSLCSRTTLLSSAQEDIDELGVGEKPTEEVSIDLNEPESKSKTEIPRFSIVYVTALIALLVLVSRFIIRRYKKNK